MRYKLKKIYPGLHENWKEGMIVTNKDYTHQYAPEEVTFTHCLISSKSVENHDEYWEKIVEKEYKIISLISYLNGEQNLLEEVSLDVWRGKSSTKFLLSEIGISIHSVKRLSDGEIFIIGDTTEQGIILAFDTPGSNKEICRYKVNDDGYGWRMLQTAIKVKKKPLFTTEDGVDIFKNDKVAVVNKKEFKYAYGRPASNAPYDKLFLYFSTREKAEEYILMNKPCLSVTDVLNVGYGINPKPLIDFISKRENDTKS